MADADGGIIDDGVDRHPRRPHRRGRPARRGRRSRPARRSSTSPARRSSPAWSMPTRTGRRATTTSSRSRTGRDRQSRAGHDDDPRSVGARGEIFAAAEMQRAGMILGAAHLLDRRDRLRRQGAPTSMPQIDSLRRCAGACPPAEGAGRAQRQELQPAAPRAAPAGGRGRAGARTCRSCAEGGSLFAMDMTLDRGRQLDARAQRPARAFLRRSCVQLLDARPRPTTRRPWSSPMAGPAGDPYWRAQTDVWRASAADGARAAGRCSPRRTPGATMAPEEDLSTTTARARRRSSPSAGVPGVDRRARPAGRDSARIGRLWSFVRGG